MAKRRDRHTFTGSSRVSYGFYDPATRTVELHFPDGTVVDYFDVPAQTWEAMKKTASVGRFLRDVLERFPFRRR
jgi:hypothetical protein